MFFLTTPVLRRKYFAKTQPAGVLSEPNLMPGILAILSYVSWSEKGRG